MSVNAIDDAMPGEIRAAVEAANARGVTRTRRPPRAG